MSVTPSPIGGFAAQFFDNNGVILSGGKIYTYAAGTSTPVQSYTSASGTTPHTNPIILDSAGRVPGGEIWLTDGINYKFVIETATSILIGSYDNISGINSNFVNFIGQQEIQTATAGQTVFTLATISYTPGTNTISVYVDGVNQYEGESYLETNGNTVTFTSGLHVGAEVKFTTTTTLSSGITDASLVTYEPPFTGAAATTVEDKLAQYVSVKDFGAIGDGVADDTAAIQAAIDTERGVFLPKGTYLVTSSLTIPYNGARMYGEDQYNTIIKAPTNSNFTMLKIGVAGGTYGQYGNVTLDNFRIDGSRALGAPSATSKGIETLWAAHIRMNNVRVTNTRGYGVEFYTGGYSSITNCNFTSHGITGLYLNGVSSTDAITSTLVQSCQISSNGTYGIHAKNFFNITLDANIIEDIGTGGAGAAIKLEGAALRNMSIIHNYLEANSDAAYDIDAGGIGIQGLSIQDNWLAGTPATSTYNFAGAAVVNGIVQGNEGGDSVVSALSAVDGIRSLELLGATQVDTSAELTTSTTGGFSQDVADLTFSAGVWSIRGVLQTNNSVGATAVGAGIALSNAPGQSGKQIATNVNFSAASDYTEAFSTQEQARLQCSTVLSFTTTTTIYMAAYIDISAGSLAYKGQLSATRIA